MARRDERPGALRSVTGEFRPTVSVKRSGKSRSPHGAGSEEESLRKSLGPSPLTIAEGASSDRGTRADSAAVGAVHPFPP